MSNERIQSMLFSRIDDLESKTDNLLADMAKLASALHSTITDALEEFEERPQDNNDETQQELSRQSRTLTIREFHQRLVALRTLVKEHDLNVSRPELKYLPPNCDKCGCYEEMYFNFHGYAVQADGSHPIS